MKDMEPHTRKVETPLKLTIYVYAFAAPVLTFIIASAPKAFVRTRAQTGTPRLFVQPRKRGACPPCAIYKTVREPM